MGEKKKIVIAEDHNILREGLKAILNADNEVAVIGEAGDGLEAVRCVQKLRPDLLLLDLSMPKMDGLSVIKEIKSQFPEIKVLALTMHESEDYIFSAFKSGADGYCLKEANRAELLNAIHTVLSGKRYFSPGISGKILDGYLEGKKTVQPVSLWEGVTEREREVLKLIGEGYKNKEIADYLCISVKTVEKHRSNIMEKLDIHTTSGLTALAIEKGLVTKESKI